MTECKFDHLDVLEELKRLGKKWGIPRDELMRVLVCHYLMEVKIDGKLKGCRFCPRCRGTGLTQRCFPSDGCIDQICMTCMGRGWMTKDQAFSLLLKEIFGDPEDP